MKRNSLIGEYVEHRTFGHGRIIAIAEKDNQCYLEVEFEKTKKRLQFLFPQVFIEQKMLSTNSQIIIQMLTSEWLCEKCGCYSAQITEWCSKRVCPACIKKTVRCRDCQVIIFPDEAALIYRSIWHSHDPVYICSSCAPKYRKCIKCGKIFNLKTRIADYPRIPEDLYLCDICTEENALTCSVCYQYYLEKDMVDIGYSHVCRACMERYLTICTRCGNSFLNKSSQNTAGLCNDCLADDMYIGYLTQKLTSNCYIKRMSWSDFKIQKSTPLMTAIRKNNGILVISSYFLDFPSVIVVYDMPSNCRYKARGSYTATALKQSDAIEFTEIVNERQKEILCKSTLYGQTVNIWENPICLRAVTDYDKDFRKEWHGDVLEYSGNDYGDCTNFYIIGTIDCD